ncbi:MAG: histidine phosphatase family protein, partial [Candidatus Eremiobacteraeota bacterium]|nr:histidine phosphatase family protein [Candidatus Eremiobacteraeota bacterium]
SFAQLKERVAEVLAELRASSFEKVLIVTHAGPLHALLQALPFQVDAVPTVRFEPASITRIAVTGDSADIVSLNDTAHLSPLPQRY